MIPDHFDRKSSGPGCLIDVDATGFHGGTRLFGVATRFLHVTALTERARACAHPERLVVTSKECLSFKRADNFEHLDSP